MLLAQRILISKQRALNLSGIAQILALWKRNSKTRQQLLELDEHQLNDIGIDRRIAVEEGNRTFWQ